MSDMAELPNAKRFGLRKRSGFCGSEKTWNVRDRRRKPRAQATPLGLKNIPSPPPQIQITPETRAQISGQHVKKIDAYKLFRRIKNQLGEIKTR
jgi:hypothetical protein